MLIQIGTRDDYEDGERSCDEFVATWQAAARDRTTVRHVEGGLHSFDIAVSTKPDLKDAVEARQAVVSFFVRNLKP